MIGSVWRALLTIGSAAAVVAARVAPFAAAPDCARTLPVFFFHGLTGNAGAGASMQQNLSTEARPFVSLTFAENEASGLNLNIQTQLAITQIRSIIKNDTRFSRGYSFIGHSQGAAIARSVIQNMDDHKVHTFISLAGASNGIFYGPQATDFLPARLFLEFFGVSSDPTAFNVSGYTTADITSGRLSIDSTKFDIAHPELQDNDSGYQLGRSPVKKLWINYNTFFPRVNNLQDAKNNKTIAAEQKRRKTNFLKLKAAYFFASSYDETISPWQSSILGQYEDVATIEELEARFATLKVLPMQQTEEYKKDTYGLKTLDARGGLKLIAMDKIGHVCWVADSVAFGRTEECKWRPVYEKSVYPLLKPIA